MRPLARQKWILVLSSMFVWELEAALIANSELRRCVYSSNERESDSHFNESEDSFGNTKCTDKVIVTLTVPGNKNLATEELSATVNTVNDKMTGGIKYLKTPVQISIRKSAVFASYPLQYLKAFNAAPFEQIEVTGLGFGHKTCRASPTDSSPTCGWHINSMTNLRIPYSQGFCCGCNMFNAIDQSIDGKLNGGWQQ